MSARMPASTSRTAGVPQGVVLLAVAILPVMGSTLIAPILPAMAAHFAHSPGAEILIPVALTVPALCIALFSPLVGMLADRIGRRRLLLAASAMYALFGVAPLVLDSLDLIVVSRVFVGITEAVLMTCSTALIGDYFAGPARAKWLASQTAVAALAATLFFALGGLLGNENWRNTFLLYAGALLVFALVAAFTWEPARNAADRVDAAPFPWGTLAGILGVTLFSALVFYIVPIQLGFIFDAIGMHSPAVIGFAAALTAFANVAGTLVFRKLIARSPRVVVPACLLVAGAGLLGIAHASDLRTIVAFAMLSQLGCGALLPTLLNWVLGGLSFAQRGRGTGAFMTAFFLGQFISPIVVIALSHLTGGLFAAIGAISLACIVFAAVLGLMNAAKQRAVSARGIVAGR